MSHGDESDVLVSACITPHYLFKICTRSENPWWRTVDIVEALEHTTNAVMLHQRCLEILAAGLLQPLPRVHVQPLNQKLFTLCILMSSNQPAATVCVGLYTSLSNQYTQHYITY